MLVAKQKRKENIVEYVLYLYQIEDLIRAFKLDIDLIKEKLVTSYKANQKVSEEIMEWYANLLLMMEKERIQEKGHLQFLSNLVSDVNDFHLKLLETKKDKAYLDAFGAATGLLSELKEKNKAAKNDVDLGVAAIYGFLLLKMQQKEISIDTTEAIKRISSWMGLLSKHYRSFEAGDLEF